MGGLVAFVVFVLGVIIILGGYHVYQWGKLQATQRQAEQQRRNLHKAVHIRRRVRSDPAFRRRMRDIFK